MPNASIKPVILLKLSNVYKQRIKFLNNCLFFFKRDNFLNYQVPTFEYFIFLTLNSIFLIHIKIYIIIIKTKHSLNTRFLTTI